MDIALIVRTVISLIPDKLRDYFFDVIEDYVEDETTGFPSKAGKFIINGARAVTDTEDFPDKGEALEEVVESVLSEAATKEGTKVDNIKHALDGIIQHTENPVSVLHIPEKLIK